jgi:hypothetical protein
VCWTYRCVGKKVVTVECSDDEEDVVEENFFRREEISRAPDGAVEDGRSDHDFTFLILLILTASFM